MARTNPNLKLTPADNAISAHLRAQILAEALPYLQRLSAEYGETVDLSILDGSHVIYLEVEKGYSELLRIHFALNQGVLAFTEPWPYHPHLTIAQNLLPEHAEELAEKISDRWKQWKGDRSFQVESVTFVQNTLSNHWVDLKEFRLPELVGVRS